MVTTKPIPFYAFNFVALSIFTLVMIVGLSLYFQSQGKTLQFSPEETYGYETSESPTATEASAAEEPVASPPEEESSATTTTTTTTPTAAASPIVCGNGKCEKGESTTSCSKDCKPSAVCGNGKIEAGEQCDGTSLGGKTCEAGFSNPSCSKDCIFSCTKTPVSAPAPAPASIEMQSQPPATTYPLTPPITSCNNADPDAPCMTLT